MRSSFAIICWRNKLLLFHRDNFPTIPFPDCWTLPGGGVEKGETHLQGLRRELLEEVSYIPKNITFLGKMDTGLSLGHIYWSFVDDEEATKFKHGIREGQEIGFFTIAEAMNLKMNLELEKGIINFRDDLIAAMKSKTIPRGILA